MSRAIGAVLLLLGLMAPADRADARASTVSSGVEDGDATASNPRPGAPAPYPAAAAGWGPTAGPGRYVSRWAEDWSTARTLGTAPPLKATPLGPGASLTLSTEGRLRYDLSDRTAPQGLYRGILGADIRATPDLRLFGELGTAQSVGRPDVGGNFQNDLALQQLFVEGRWAVGPSLVGAMVGRQEFADGPRQLVSVGDGPNLHRSWNGVRLYVHDPAWRFGMIELRGTRLGRGAFDDGINDAERLRGLNASFDAGAAKDRPLFIDPFWLRSENPAFGALGRTGPDDRDSYGVRIWGTHDATTFDWTLARQTGSSVGRAVDAWGLFASQSRLLSTLGWKPRLGVRLDAASGGSAGRAGFNQLYASSNYVSEGLFLSTSNLLLVAPSIALAPSAATTLSIEYGFARRLVEDDAAYAGLMRAYPGTADLPGREIGGLLRLAGTWSIGDTLSFGAIVERFAPGELLRQAGTPAGTYGYLRTTYRY